MSAFSSNSFARMNQLAVATVVMLVIPFYFGCNAVNFTMVDGYSFDYEGETAETADGGGISPNVTRINVVNKFGNVDVKLVDGSVEPNWNWAGKVWATDQDLADKLAQELVVEVKTEGDTQTWTLLMPESQPDFRGAKSNLTLAIGTNMKVALNNRHGDTEVTGVKQHVDIECGFGELKLSDYGSANAKISHGEGLITDGSGDLSAGGTHSTVVIQNVGGDIDFDGIHTDVAVKEVSGEAVVKTTFDRLLVSNIKGKSKLSNSHGNIEGIVFGDTDLSNSFGNTKLHCHGSNIKGRSSHGNFELHIQNTAFKKVDLKTSFDDIDLFLPNGMKPKISMNTSFGESDSRVNSDDSNTANTVELNNSHGDINVKYSK